MRAKERLEQLERLIDEAKTLNLTLPFIVEGERDEIALRELGFSGEIVVINRGVSLLQICEEISVEHSEAVILTDWDSRGGKLAHLLREKLLATDVKSNNYIRARFSKLCKKEIKDVESLPNYLERLREQVLRK